MIKNLIIILGFTAILISCASKPPKQQENICSIFEQKSSWYRIVNKSYEKWDAPIHVQMAIMRQESAFQNRIKPERTKLLGVIPWKKFDIDDEDYDIYDLPTTDYMFERAPA